MTTTRIPQSACASCQIVHDAATSAKGETPDPGDITLCIICGEWNVFDNEMKLRLPTTEEHIEIGKNPNAQAHRAAWLKIRKSND